MMRINFYNNNQTPTFNARRLSAAKPEIEALLRQGKTPKDIAAAYKHNPSWGSWIIKRFELEPLRNQIKEDIENQIIALRKSGATIKTIVEIVNLSTKKVTDIITKSGVKKPRKTTFQKGNINLERNNIIKAELAKGFTIKEVAKNTGYSAYIIKNFVKDLDKNELKIAKEQLKLERTKELANSVYDDLKISGNVQDIIENNEKLKTNDISINKQQLRKELGRLKNKKYTKIITDMLNAGYIASEIARKLDCSLSTIVKYANKAGISNVKEPRRNFMREQIMNLVVQGKKLKEIAEELNCSCQSLYNNMGNVGKLQRREYLQQRENEIYNLHLQGIAHNEIAERYNVSIDTVDRNIRKHQNRL